MMSRAARLNDRVKGMTGGEHSGHMYPHSPCLITGTITPVGSTNVYINNKPAVRVTDVTREYDCCCDGGIGSIRSGSSRVLVNGLSASRVGDRIQPHNGEAVIDPSDDNGSHNVFIY